MTVTETMTPRTVTSRQAGMGCLICATEAGQHASTAPVVGCCVYCEAAVCLDHVHIIPVPAHPVGLLPRPAGARRIVCPVCARTL